MPALPTASLKDLAVYLIPRSPEDREVSQWLWIWGDYLHTCTVDQIARAIRFSFDAEQANAKENIMVIFRDA